MSFSDRKKQAQAESKATRDAAGNGVPVVYAKNPVGDQTAEMAALNCFIGVSLAAIEDRLTLVATRNAGFAPAAQKAILKAAAATAAAIDLIPEYVIDRRDCSDKQKKLVAEMAAGEHLSKRADLAKLQREEAAKATLR